MRLMALTGGVTTQALAAGTRMVTMAAGAAAAATAAVNVVMARIGTTESGGGRRQLRDIILQLQVGAVG